MVHLELQRQIFLIVDEKFMKISLLISSDMFQYKSDFFLKFCCYVKNVSFILLASDIKWSLKHCLVNQQVHCFDCTCSIKHLWYNASPKIEQKSITRSQNDKYQYFLEKIGDTNPVGKSHQNLLSHILFVFTFT